MLACLLLAGVVVAPLTASRADDPQPQQAQRPTRATVRAAVLEYDAANDTTAALAALAGGLKQWPDDPGLLAAQGRIQWRLLRTRSAEESLLKAAKAPAYAAEAQYWLGKIYYFKGYQAENAFPGWHEEVAFRPQALRAFMAARDARPEWALPHLGLGDIAKAEGREADASAEYARAKALDATAGQPDAGAADAQAVLDAAKASQWASVLERGTAFVSSHRSSTRLLEVLDAMLNALQATPDASAQQVRTVIDARLALRPDPMAHAAAANLLLARRVDLERVATIATAGKAAGELFIRENESSYRLDGKAQGSRDRNAAQFADVSGWAAFLQGNKAEAERLLAEAERLSRGTDPVNQMHLGQLSRDKRELETARDHYLAVLGLAAASPASREGAKAALAGIQTDLGESPAGFDTWLTSTLERLRDERRRTLLTTMAGKPLPPLVLTDLQGHKVDLEAEHGNVVLLNFFAAW